MNNTATASGRIDLDGAGIIYPYVATDKWNSVYRIEAYLKQPVDPDMLNYAVGELRRKYPYFFMTLAKTMTKYFLRKCNYDAKTVYNSYGEICKPFNLKSGEPLIRFLYSENKIILEMFHSITDGHGAMELMKNLLSRYCKACDGQAQTEVNDTESFLDDKTDIFEELYSMGGKNISRIITSAYQIKRPSPNRLQYTDIEIPCSQLKKSAHFYGVSVAMLVCALQIKAIAMSQKDIGRKEIRISVPVDLRKIFRISSCRNSSLYFLVSAKMKETEKFTDLLDKIKKQFQENITDENMRNLAYTNVSSAKLKVFKILPVFTKKAILKFGYTHLGENQFTATMTDIGIVSFDDDVSRLVDNVYFVLGEQKTKPINIAVTTYNETVQIIVSYNTDCSSFIDALKELIKKYVL